ncbi:MAG: hypothetical protein JW772_04255 [Candidatus Diapherotrites archaeon]|nr:hypothetical protein [Candidatus Diapherotrites archaeon]
MPKKKKTDEKTEKKTAKQEEKKEAKTKKTEEKKEAPPKTEKKAETQKKEEEKKPAKEKKEEAGKKAQEEKKAKALKKKIIEKWVNPKKSQEAKKMSRLVKKKRMFRGRFGQRNRRRKISNEKWQKWRKPHGMDIIHKREDGVRVKIGFRNSNITRGLHPSGYKEVLVRNMAELEAAAGEKNSAVRIARTIGIRKKKEMLKKAKELKLWVLNA